MSFGQRWQEIRAGFEPAFWVANITELFERLSYYGQSAVLAIFLHETLHLSVVQTGSLMGAFGFAVWFLPILGGSLADRFGFRRSLAAAYLILTAGYFLMGSLTATWMTPIARSISLYWLVFAVLMVPALGPSVVKPCVAGTTARASTENVRSIGYSIYYTLVNVGGTLGPIMAWLVRKKLGLGIENVFRVSAFFVFLMFIVTLVFYKEPVRSGEKQVPSVLAALKNMLVVVGNGRFISFLLIYSGFWVVYWQQYIALPLYIRGYVNANADVDLLLSVDALSVICLQIVISYLTRKVPTIHAITIGVLVSSLSWLILSAHPATYMAVVALFVLALGEMMQSARYYEYVSRLAPSGQQGTYMGYAFLPIAIGYFIAGPLAGHLVSYFGDVLHRPARIWWIFSAIGVATALLMAIYNAVVKPDAPPAQ